MYFVYVIRSIHYQNRYIGSTGNVNARVSEHNRGKNRYTKGRRPWKLIHEERFKTRSEAMRREIFFKSGQGRKYLDSILRKK